MKNLLEGKKVKLKLVGLDGNAFSLMGHFRAAAKKQGFSEDQIKNVLEECRKSDYDYLLSVLVEHTY